MDHKLTSSALADRLQSRLRRLLWSLRALVLIEGVAVLTTFWAASFALLVALDYPLRLSVAARAALLAPVAAGLVVLMLRHIAAPLRLKMNLSDAAHLVEQRQPALASLLVSAVRFSQGQIGSSESNSPQLAAEVVRKANVEGERLDCGVHVRRHRAVASIGVVTGVAACLCIWSSVCGSSLGLALRRTMMLSGENWPQRTRLILDVEGDRITAARGDDFDLHARVEGVMPRSVEIVYTQATGVQGREPMTLVGDAGVRYTFLNLDAPLKFHLEGGDDRTREVEVTLSERPRFVEASVTVEPPAYARLEPERLPRDQRLIKALPGSRVEMELHSSEPLRSLDVAAGDSPPIPVPGDQDRWRLAVIPETTTTYAFTLTGAGGLVNKRPERFTVRHIKDEPPGVRLTLRGAAEMVTAEAVLPVELVAEDELGLAEVAVDVSHSAAPAALQPLLLNDFEIGTRRFAFSQALAVRETGASPGETLTISAWASDLNDVGGPGVTRSSPITLRIVTPEELAAEFARREQEYREEFQRLLDQQEEVRRQLLTAAEGMDEATPAADRLARLAPIERRQRSLGSAVGSLAKRFQRIVEELRINGMDALGLGERMERGIVAPLDALSTVHMPGAGDQLKQWAAGAPEGIEAAVDASQARLLQLMREALSRMRETEGYHETVTMLQDIIRLQQELNAETRKKLDAEGATIFDD